MHQKSLPPRGKAIFFRLISWLPLGGKLSTKLTDEGRNLFSEIRERRQNLGFPLPEKNSEDFIFLAKIVSRYAASPLACIKFCLQNFLRQKCEAYFIGFPLGGGSLRSKVVRGNCIYDSQNFQTKGRQPVSLKKIPAQSIKKGRVADKRLLITLARKIFLKTLKNRRSNV